MGQIHYTFFFRRRGLTLETFLAGVDTVEKALARFEDSNLFGFELEEIVSFLNSKEKIDVKPNPAKKKIPASKSRVSKSATEKKKTTKSRSRRRTTKKKTVEKKNGEKDDSSYFETWKVPYVEP